MDQHGPNALYAMHDEAKGLSRSAQVILAAGEGTRLRPLTNNMPKSNIRLDNKALIERLIERLVCKGTTALTIVVRYLADQVIGLLGDGSRLGCSIQYCHQRAPATAESALTSVLETSQVDTFTFYCCDDILNDDDINFLMPPIMHEVRAIGRVAEDSRAPRLKLSPSGCLLSLSSNSKQPLLTHNISVPRTVLAEFADHLDARNDCAFAHFLASNRVSIPIRIKVTSAPEVNTLADFARLRRAR